MTVFSLLSSDLDLKCLVLVVKLVLTLIFVLTN